MKRVRLFLIFNRKSALINKISIKWSRKQEKREKKARRWFGRTWKLKQSAERDRETKARLQTENLRRQSSYEACQKRINVFSEKQIRENNVSKYFARTSTKLLRKTSYFLLQTSNFFNSCDFQNFKMFSCIKKEIVHSSLEPWTLTNVLLKRFMSKYNIKLYPKVQ